MKVIAAVGVCVMAVVMVACAPPPEPAPAVLAIAYVNVDGVNGFTPSTDVLISKLVDTSGDKAPSAGDLVVSNRYPLTFDVGQLGTFQVTKHPVVSVDFASYRQVVVRDANATQYYFNSGAFGPTTEETYREQLWNGMGVLIADYLVGPTPEYLIVNSIAPSAPDSPVDLTRNPGPGDDRFVDVDIYTPG
jgi:hypothetical protein